ncbi:hypothetical protein KSX_17450 [Ktedonospora formicarum]|uniref:Uncharacterized protein n=2 Tax=Ktedonospora formicarum TaxID=2778364 RepID=A0A8J3HZM9_9CHLR|nr:hypothetical protein KSX_17450 [Ktedonospora formicarum]
MGYSFAERVPTLVNPYESGSLMHLTQETGTVVRTYGRFLLREVFVYQGERLRHSALLQITLLPTSGNEITIAYLSTRADAVNAVKERVHVWLMEQSCQIEKTRRWLQETSDQDIVAKFQSLLDLWEPCYQEVAQALSELEELSFSEDA